MPHDQQSAVAAHPAAITEDRRRGGAPQPDRSDKPDSPRDLTSSSWRYIARQTMREFSEDQCTDSAAALTYYAALAIFPAMLALVSLLGVIGQQSTAEELLASCRTWAPRRSPIRCADRWSSSLRPRRPAGGW